MSRFGLELIGHMDSLKLSLVTEALSIMFNPITWTFMGPVRRQSNIGLSKSWQKPRKNLFKGAY